MGSTGKSSTSSKLNASSKSSVTNTVSKSVNNKPSNLDLNTIASHLYARSNTKTIPVSRRVSIDALRDAKKETTASVKGILTTLKKAATPQGAFNSDFNNDVHRNVIMQELNKIAPNRYEFRQVTVGNNQVVPGFNFMGFPVKGNIYEWRLFDKNA